MWRRCTRRRSGTGRRRWPGSSGAAARTQFSGQDWDLARQWRAAGVSDAEIGRRLGVAHTTIGRRLGPRAQQDAEPLFAGSAQVTRMRMRRVQGPGPPRDRSRMTRLQVTRWRRRSPVTRRTRAPGPLIREGAGESRYAGAMLLHAFLARAWRRDGAGRGPLAAGHGAGRPRSARASRSARRRSSSSSTWPPLTPGRWPGSGHCPPCGPCGPSWPRSLTAPTRWRCRPRSRRRCWPRTR